MFMRLNSAVALAALLLITCVRAGRGESGRPEQVHLSYGAEPDQMIVTWLTQAPVDESIVEYGCDDEAIRQANGSSSLFVDGGLHRRKRTIHRVLLVDLLPGKTYWYHCGSNSDGWSPLFYFKSMPSGSDWSPRFAVYGDMGSENAQSLARLQEDTVKGMYDAVLHVGDFAYDMHSKNGDVGDEFMRQIEPIAAYVPYMTCPGNHEEAYNFSNYVNRFTMPSRDGGVDGGDNNHFYSVNVGPVHVVSFSTEFYFFVEYGFAQIERQYDWLVKDLQIRTGLPFIKRFGLEEIFYKYGVDLEFYGHEHSYERLWPIYDYQVLNGSAEQPYTNPRAPVHIITGSAGCKEKRERFGPSQYYSAFRSRDYGYARMTVHNATHLYLEQVSDDQAGKVIDQIWIVKDKSG